MIQFRLTAKALQSIFVFGLFLVLSPACRAQGPTLPGRYVCTEAKMGGKAVPCTGTPLVLKTDGHFELHGWQGQYVVNADTIDFVDSDVRVQAKMQPGHKIVLHYRGKHGMCEMIYERRRVAEMGKTALS